MIVILSRIAVIISIPTQSGALLLLCRYIMPILTLQIALHLFTFPSPSIHPFNLDVNGDARF